MADLLTVEPAGGCPHPGCGGDGTVNVDHHDAGTTAYCIDCGREVPA